MAQSLEVVALRNIARDATRLLNVLGHPSTSKSNSTPLTRRSYPTLPHPESLTDHFLSQGLARTVAEGLSTIYMRSATQMKANYDDELRRAIDAVSGLESHGKLDAEKTISAIYSAFLTRYTQTLRGWPERALEMANKRRLESTRSERSSPPLITEKRSAFKPEGIPTLENAFIDNAYPNKQEKEILAQVTGMEYKQINIWFQNRRARAKKESGPLKRTAAFTRPLVAEQFAKPTLTMSEDVDNLKQAAPAVSQRSTTLVYHRPCTRSSTLPNTLDIKRTPRPSCGGACQCRGLYISRSPSQGNPSAKKTIRAFANPQAHFPLFAFFTKITTAEVQIISITVSFEAFWPILPILFDLYHSISHPKLILEFGFQRRA
ncbi:hypothetical protein EIP91_006161 [Steccherinum ochraceum]|uniref:Homeobox domain-containing protein n=1 Tax=Steccherinum ochraceum TaxID=92696 RepID=A0A4R0REI6_9APHY|nr:hypothetical protein EIP91_006161 [Steccherinum ochraceum]